MLAPIASRLATAIPTLQGSTPTPFPPTGASNGADPTREAQAIKRMSAAEAPAPRSTDTFSALDRLASGVDLRAAEGPLHGDSPVTAAAERLARAEALRSLTAAGDQTLR